jgi:hypothetical protein
MAATALIAASTAASNSADVTIAAGATVTFALFTAAGGRVPNGFEVPLRKKNSSGTYSDSGAVLSARNPVLQLTGPLVIRAEKPLTSETVGVDQDT